MLTDILAAYDAVKTAWTAESVARLKTAYSQPVPADISVFVQEFPAALRIAMMQHDRTSEMFPLLDRFARAKNENGLDQREIDLASLLSLLQQSFIHSAGQCLAAEQALELVEAVLPVFQQATSWAIKLEMETYFSYMAQELAQANLTLEQLDRSKSDFIAIAAHELKTPLTLIEGYSSMLRDHLPPGASEPALLLDGVNTGSKRLRQIVDDMIDVSLIDNCLLSLHFQPIWLERLLRDIQHEFHSIVLQRRQTLEVLPFPGSQEMTFGDPERLAQAFRNLVANAVKYTPDGGSIRIDGRKLPGFVELLVQDTGIGIQPEHHTRIFEKFGRLGDAALHSSSKVAFKGGGPGLGLPIAKGIITAHGGAIWVESECRDEQRCPGSVFHVLLPLRKTPPDDRSARLFHPLTGLEGKSENQR